MSVSSRAVVDFILLGPTHDRRQLQDSPLLGDVWAEFAEHPAAPVDLLISPYKTQSAGRVAKAIADRLELMGVPHPIGQEAHVAYLQGVVAARLFFPEVLRVVVPVTNWWAERAMQEQLRTYRDDTSFAVIDHIIAWTQAKHPDHKNEAALKFSHCRSLDRYIALAGLILWARSAGATAETSLGELLDTPPGRAELITRLRELFRQISEDPTPSDPLVWQVSLNRKAMPALEKSVAAVKGDAAGALFKVRCNDIAWAVIDSGIDAMHPAFDDEAPGTTRVVKNYDFSNIREVVSLDNLAPARAKARAESMLQGRNPQPADLVEAGRALNVLAMDADNDRPINWALVGPFVEIPRETEPFSGHGTHVAGILGANAGRARAGGVAMSADGMCPDIKLYDFRVLAKSLQDTEFAVIAALQYIRYLNDRHTFTTVHGVNLSLSIPHDVRNFACGRTPVCDECERLVGSGVVVVAAAGNLGYHSFETKDGAYEGYTAFSITDPGNADGVITVGATHRFWPHTYGVSFFSSRGPTGDGRLKPDLVAPGERIQSSLPNRGWGELDGTSMAAPHVSGAAAMLMGRYSELIGQPRRIKQILCESATDLGRERTFQGHGMLDVLRALQQT
jgi:serine protease AprX